MASTRSNGRGDEITEYSVVIANHKNELSDITDLVYSVEVYQSIFNGFVVAKIVVNDKINFINTFPLIGEERVQINLNSSASKTSRSMDFVVISVDEIDYSKSLAGQNYCVTMITQEGIRNELNLISQSYRGEVSDIAAKIYTDALKITKPMIIEKTGGNGDVPIIIPKMKPMTALNFLRNRAVSSEYSSHAFFAFETLTGFYFTSPEKLLQEPEIATYTFNHAITKSYTPYDIIDFKHVKKVDFLDELKGGYFYSETLQFDFLNKTPNVVKYDESQASSWKTLETKKRHSDQFSKDFAVGSSRRFMIPIDTSRTGRDYSEVIGNKHAYLMNMIQNQVEITVPGNMDIFPGSIVNLKIPNVSTDRPTEESPQISGKYFVADVIHISMTTQKIFTRLLLFKDSFR